jgi:hypothetical protein
MTSASASFKRISCDVCAAEITAQTQSGPSSLSVNALKQIRRDRQATTASCYDPFRASQLQNSGSKTVAGPTKKLLWVNTQSISGTRFDLKPVIAGNGSRKSISLPPDELPLFLIPCKLALACGEQMQVDQSKHREFITLLGGAAAS